MFEWIVSSCFLILVVLALRAALGRKINARFRYALWALVLIRLLVPVQLFTLPVARDSIPVIASVPEQQLESEPEYMHSAQVIPMEEAGRVSGVSAAALPQPENSGSRTIENKYVSTVSPLEILKILWAIGGMALALILLASNLHFSLCLRRVRKPLRDIGCRTPVYRAQGLPSPCLFGILRPAVYVTPGAAESPVILRHVLAHELTHYRHLDHIWSILRGIALAVHWWNPLVWLAVVCSRRDGELACDEGALKELGRGERTAYGETLLTLVTAMPDPLDLLSCATTMSGEQRSLRERLQRIACEPRQFAAAAVAVAMIALLTSACAFGQMGEAEPDVDAPPQPVYQMEDMPNFGSRPVLSGDRKEGVYTFLLTGVDSVNGNTDTIMLASYDTSKQNISLMSTPRDTAVMDGGQIGRLNYARSISALRESVAALTGITPDYYVQVDLDIVSRLVDLLGGVMFDVPVDMDYDDPYQNLHIHLRKGAQILDGEQAMGLVRYRWYKEGDIARIGVQQDFIKALMRECLDLKNWNKVTEYINLVLENAETDLEPASMAWFAANLLGLNGAAPLNMDDVYTCTLPVEDEMQIVNGLSVVVSRIDQVAELVNEWFNPYQQNIAASTLEAPFIEQS